MTPVEFWLPIGAIAFYLYDSAQLLWHNELLYVRGAGRWHAEGPSSISMMGRRLYLPNPLLPQRAAFKVHWKPDEQRTPATSPDEFLRALRPIGAIVLMLAWLLALLPLLSWTLGTGITLLAVFALYYLLVIVALVFVLRRRAVLQLSASACASLIFDALACAPFAANLVRKITLRRGLDGDPIAFAGAGFEPVEREALRQLLLRKLGEQQAGEPLSTEQQARIAVLLAKLGDSPT